MAKHLENTGVVNFIGVGTKIDGEISSNGDIRVDGTLNGSIKTKGKVVIGSTGIVEGNGTLPMPIFLANWKAPFR